MISWLHLLLAHFFQDATGDDYLSGYGDRDYWTRCIGQLNDSRERTPGMGQAQQRVKDLNHGIPR